MQIEKIQNEFNKMKDDSANVSFKWTRSRKNQRGGEKSFLKKFPAFKTLKVRLRGSRAAHLSAVYQKENTVRTTGCYFSGDQRVLKLP